MSGITDLVQQQLTPERINEISSAIGTDPATTQQAVSAAIPMIVGGMAAHAATPAGAATIENESANHAGILGQLGGMLGGGSGGGGLLGGLGGMLGGAAGGGLLGSILGGTHADVTNGVSQASGLDSQATKRLLMILAPIVLAAVAHHRSTASSGADVGSVLQQEAQAHVSNPRYGGILGGILNKATGQS